MTYRVFSVKVLAMSETLDKVTSLPVDSLAIARRVQSMSTGVLKRVVRKTVEDEALSTKDVEVFGKSRYTANLVSPEEYAKKKIGNSQLAIHSTIDMARTVNESVGTDGHEGMNAFLNDVSLGEAGFSKVCEGKYTIGFMMSEEYIDRLALERPQIIDTVLDVASLAITDPFRQWRNEGCDHVNMPVLDIYTADPDAEEILNSFTGALNENLEEMTVDLFEVKARPVIHNISPSLLLGQAA